MISNQGKKTTLYSSIHNTLYLEVHCPSVRPSIIVVSESGNDLVDFGKVAIGKLIFFSGGGEGELEQISMDQTDNQYHPTLASSSLFSSKSGTVQVMYFVLLRKSTVQCIFAPVET